MELAALSVNDIANIVALGGAVLVIGYAIYYLGTLTTRTYKKASHSIQRTSEEESKFPDSYHTARQNFLNSSADSGGRIESFQNPAKGPAGEELFMDVAQFGEKNAKNVLVVSSGTHGVEGFAGSGIQTKLLREGIVHALPSSVNLFMIHAINPYGMAHLRRFNEDNVDLNRNFVNHSLTKQPNTEYAKLSDNIAPDSISFLSEIQSWSRLLWFKLIKGRKGIQAAIEGGQYSYPKGLFYGGTSESWSNRTIRSVARQYLTNANQVVCVDIHTGLGKFGAAEIILNVAKESEEFSRARKIWGSEMAKPTKEGDAVAPHLHGSLKAALSEELPQRVPMTAVSLEFGTLPMLRVFIALRAENWLYHYGGPAHPKANEIKKCLLKTFHPGTREWEDTVWEKGKDVIDKALSYLT